MRGINPFCDNLNTVKISFLKINLYEMFISFHFFCNLRRFIE
jgi:hypothetical protein